MSTTDALTQYLNARARVLSIAASGGAEVSYDAANDELKSAFAALRAIAFEWDTAERAGRKQEVAK